MNCYCSLTCDGFWLGLSAVWCPPIPTAASPAAAPFWSWYKVCSRLVTEPKACIMYQGLKYLSCQWVNYLLAPTQFSLSISNIVIIQLTITKELGSFSYWVWFQSTKNKAICTVKCWYAISCQQWQPLSYFLKVFIFNTGPIVTDSVADYCPSFSLAPDHCSCWAMIIYCISGTISSYLWWISVGSLCPLSQLSLVFSWIFSTCSSCLILKFGQCM